MYYYCVQLKRERFALYTISAIILRIVFKLNISGTCNKIYNKVLKKSFYIKQK